MHCTPLYKSVINITADFINQSEINIEGKINGDIYTKNEAGTGKVQKEGSYSWSKQLFPAGVKFIQAFVSDTLKFANDLLGYAYNSSNNNTSNAPAIQQFAAQISKLSFLKSGLSDYPWLKGALAALEVFVSGGKKPEAATPQTVKIMPMGINMTAKFTGTLTTVFPYNEIKIPNPGSKDVELDIDNYPYYNEVMGVFNLIKTPEVWWERQVEMLNAHNNNPSLSCPNPPSPSYLPCTDLTVNVDRFKLDTNTIRYVLNPAAGLAIQNMQFQLITDGEYNGSFYQNWGAQEARKMIGFTFTGKDSKTNRDKFSTDLWHAKSFAQKTFKVYSNFSSTLPNAYYGYWEPWRPMGIKSRQTTAYLKVILNLKRTDNIPNTQNVLYVLTYPVKLKQGNQMQYWEDISNYPGDTTLLTAARPTEVDSFCRSQVYNNIDRQRINGSPNPIDSINNNLVIGKSPITIFPNPNNGNFTLRIGKQIDFLTSIVITDITGRRVFASDETNITLENGYTKNLSITSGVGLYIITCKTKKGKQLTTKFFVK